MFPFHLGSCELFLSPYFINFCMSCELRSHHSVAHHPLECVPRTKLHSGACYPAFLDPTLPIPFQPQLTAVLLSTFVRSGFWLPQMDEHTQYLVFSAWLISLNKMLQFCPCSHQRQDFILSNTLYCIYSFERKKKLGDGGWWHTLLISALKRQS